MPRGSLLLPLLPLLPVLLAGCFTYPCDTDVLACEDGDAFVVDRACVPTGELGVGLRESGSESPMPATGWPELHHGVQGGIHYALGLDLVQVDDDHRQFEIAIEVRDCEGACLDMAVVAQRTLVVDDDWLDERGDALVLDDVIVLLDREPRSIAELEVIVTDSCGRTTTTTRRTGN